MGLLERLLLSLVLGVLEVGRILGILFLILMALGLMLGGQYE